MGYNAPKQTVSQFQLKGRYARQYLSFAGKSSKDFLLYLSGPGVYDSPAADVESTSVPGRNGDIITENARTGRRRYQNVDIKYKAFFFNGLPAKTAAVKAWLLSPIGYQKLQDTYDPDFFRMAVCKDALEFDVTAQKAAEMELTFNCKPQRWSVDGQRVLQLDGRSTLKNPFAFPAQPIFKVYGDSGGELYVGEEKIIIHSIQDYVLLNCETHNAYKACEQMYQQMKGNSVSVERLETLDAQIKELEEKLQETIGRQVTAMRDAVLEQNLELNESLAEGNITLDEIDSDIRNGLTGNDIGASFYHADYEEGSEIEAYASLAKDIRQRIESFRKEKETLSQEQGALTVMKKNFDLFIACLKELPEQNAAGMPLKVNGLDVQGSLFRDVDGKPVDGAVASLKRGRLKITPERIAEAPDLLHFEKGIYCAFMKKGTVKGDIVLYETNFGVTLPTCGNQRTLTSFLGFKKCSLDGLVMLVDAPYRVYDNTVQYRRYLRSKAKREQAV